jgi:hypothetical protein
VVLRPNGL